MEIKPHWAETFINWFPTHTDLYIRGERGANWHKARQLREKLFKALVPFFDRLRDEARSEPARPAFVTGSHVYGTPTKHSDLDLVLVANSDDNYAQLLFELSDDTGSDAGNAKHGKLDLITVTPEEYGRWKRARDRCLSEAPVTKERAIQIHREEGAGW